MAMMLARPSNDQPRLSIIDEDSDHPTVPSNSSLATSHRPFSKRWRDRPPEASHEYPPPKYSVWDVSGPRGEKLMDVRNNKYIAKRGGWKRLCLVLLVLGAIALALGVGLGVGLHKHEKSSDGRSSSSDTTNTTDPFPIGSYWFGTNLATVSTNCTSNAATWRCSPYVTYSTSASQSNATFDWTIQGPPANLTISSSNNPFAISFTNASLSLLDRDTENERYHFSVLLDKVVYPSASITDDNSNAACFFNGTEFSASLYTKKGSSDEPVDVAEESDSQTNRMMWTHAVEVTQTIHGGNSVPSCFKTENGMLGSQVTMGLDAQPANNLCECAWRNFDL